MVALFPALRTSCNCCSVRVPTGRIILPPSASCSMRGSGIRRSSSSHQDLVEGRVFRKSAASISLHDMNIVVAVPLQGLACFVDQLRLTFHRPNFRRKLSKNCGFVAGACTYFQNAIFRTELQLLQHGCHNIGLRNGLARADRQRRSLRRHWQHLRGQRRSRVEPLLMAESTRSSRMPRARSCSSTIRLRASAQSSAGFVVMEQGSEHGFLNEMPLSDQTRGMVRAFNRRRVCFRFRPRARWSQECCHYQGGPRCVPAVSRDGPSAQTVRCARCRGHTA